MVLTTRNMTYIALYTSLTIAISVFTRFTAGVIPFSLLPLMVMLAGGILGSRLGLISILLYVLMGLLGIPVFAKPPFGGFAYVFQPSFGFLLGFILAAYLIGKIIEKGSDNILTYLLANFIGIIVINVVGLLYFWFLFNSILGKPMGLLDVIKIGFLPFIVPDLVKGVIAAYLSIAIGKRLQLKI